VVGKDARSKVLAMASAYLPQALLVGTSGESSLPLFLQRYDRDKTRIFVCQDNVCQLPVEEPADAETIYHIK